MLPYRDSRLTKITIAIFFIVLLGYSYYELRGFLFGPHIVLPESIMQTDERFVTLRGRADRIAALNMNGAPISVTEDGTFEEPYLLSPGLNLVVFDATDKYGRSIQALLQVVYTPTSAPSSATTTPEIGPFPEVATTTP